MGGGLVQSLVSARDGTVRVSTRNRQLKCGLPRHSEEYRRRIRILAIAMDFIKMKLTNQSWLSSTSLRVWDDHTEYLMGPHVKGLHAKDAEGNNVMPAPWSLVLVYDQKLREKAAELCMMENFDVGAALIKAREDAELRQVYLHTPMTVTVGVATRGGAKRLRAEADSDSDGGPSDKRKRTHKTKVKDTQKKRYEDEGTQNKPKGKGKGKKGDKGKGNREKFKTRTSDGKPICFNFNNGKCKGSCGKIHVCQICLSTKHGYKQCDA